MKPNQTPTTANNARHSRKRREHQAKTKKPGYHTPPRSRPLAASPTPAELLQFFAE